MPFFVAGRFGQRSVNNGDVTIEARNGTTLVGGPGQSTTARTSAIYEYTPFCNGPGDVKSPRVMSRRRAHASVRGRRRGRHTMLSEGTVSLSRYAWFVG
jgi:hypothetical protein